MVTPTGLQCITAGSLVAANACLLQHSTRRGQVWVCNMPNRWSVAMGLCGRELWGMQGALTGLQAIQVCTWQLKSAEPANRLCFADLCRAFHACYLQRMQSALLKLPSVRVCAAGNRLWGKELDLKLALVDWSPDGRRLLFATDTGECHIYDSNGNAITKLTLYCMVSWYQGILGGTAPRLHVLSSTVLLSFVALPPGERRWGSGMSDAARQCLRWNGLGSKPTTWCKLRLCQLGHAASCLRLA